MYHHNPYNNRSAIDNPIKLFGRQSIIWSIYSAITNRQSIAICGLPGIGKTSILKCLPSSQLQQEFKKEFEQDLYKEFEQDLDQCIFVYVNLEEYLLESYEGFFETLSKFIANEVTGRLQLADNSEKGAAGFTEILDQICKKNFHLVLLIDMFDEIEKNKHIHHILAFLRAKATSKKVSYVVASISPLAEICRRDSVGSPFHNIFYTYFIKSLSREDALKLIRAVFIKIEPSLNADLTTKDATSERINTSVDGSSVPEEKVDTFFTEAEAQWVLKKAGLHPFFIQGICRVLFEEKLQSSNGHVDLHHVQKLAYEDLLPHFQDTWSHLSEEDLIALQNEARQKEKNNRVLPELSESALFRQFVRNLCHIQLFKMTSKELENALDKIDELSSLGETNLRFMSVFSRRLEKDVPAERGRVIRAILQEAFERLRGPSVRSDTDPVWQSYNILYYRYFRHHLKNEQIAARIGVSVRQYFRYRAKAIEALLDILFEMENESDVDE